MPKLSKAKIAQLHKTRGMIKRQLRERSDDKAFRLHWEDELRVIEADLKGAGEKIRVRKSKKGSN
jgi:hypothetical protein